MLAAGCQLQQTPEKPGNAETPDDGPTSAEGPPTLPTLADPSPFRKAARSKEVAHVPFVVPPHIAGYRILRLLGAGGMGLVYESVQEALGRVVALKVMQPGSVSHEALARFESEAKALGKLSHPNIARVFDAGVFRPEGDRSSIVPYLSMEYVEGAVTLNEHCERADVDLGEKLRLVAQMCDALHHAHAANIIHRDLKPSNILVHSTSGQIDSPAADFEIKLIDFGIAKDRGDGSRTITSQGQLIGTPSYMAPEQLLGSKVDSRTDVYSVGVILYQICTGRLPHEIAHGTDRRSMERTICETPPVPPRILDRALAGDLETIILRCLQKLPADRYQSTQEIREDLLAFLSGETIKATRDSTVRVMSRAVGRVAGRHRFYTFMGCFVVATLFAMLAVAPAFIRWQQLTQMYWSGISKLAPVTGSLPDVRTIVIDNDTNLTAIGASLGLTQVTGDNIRSARLLHAEVLKRLAKAEARAVGIDIQFPHPSEFDLPLLDAIRGLHERGIGVVLANPGWQFGEDGLPAIAPEFARLGWSGPPTGRLYMAEIWMMDLALERDASEVIPSFTLLTFAASREPSAEITTAMIDGVVEVRYYKPGTNRRAPLRAPDRITLSGIETFTKPDEESGILAGDRMGVFFAPIPIDGLERTTISIQKVLTMSDSELRREFGGRTVLIGNNSENAKDFVFASNGNKVFGVWAHAATLQQMLRDRVLEIPSVTLQWLVASLFAFAGVALAFSFRSTWSALLIALGLTLLALCASVLLLRSGGAIWNPIPAIAAGWLGCGLASIAAQTAWRVGHVRLRSV